MVIVEEEKTIWGKMVTLIHHYPHYAKPTQCQLLVLLVITQCHLNTNHNVTDSWNPLSGHIVSLQQVDM